MLRRHPLPVFFALAYGLSWLLWAPPVLAAWGVLPRPASPVWHLLGSLGPALAALVVARLSSGPAALRDLLCRMVDGRVPARWHAVAWGAPFALFLTAVLAARLVWHEAWNPATFGQSPELPGLGFWGYWAVSLVFYGWGEETGWRGFALPHLQARRSALGATLLLSAGWAGWHLPLFAFTPGFSRMAAPAIAGWCFSLVTAAVLFTWLFNSTRGSVLVVAAFHGTMDVAFLAPEPPSVASVLGMLVTLWGLAVLVVAGPRYLSRRGKVVAGPGGALAEVQPSGGKAPAARPT